MEHDIGWAAIAPDLLMSDRELHVCCR